MDMQIYGHGSSGKKSSPIVPGRPFSSKGDNFSTELAILLKREIFLQSAAHSALFLPSGSPTGG
jgi:hypothetical protein